MAWRGAARQGVAWRALDGQAGASFPAWPVLRNYLKRAHFADSHQWTLWKGAADGQDETSGETAANDLAGTG